MPACSHHYVGNIGNIGFPCCFFFFFFKLIDTITRELSQDEALGKQSINFQCMSSPGADGGRGTLYELPRTFRFRTSVQARRRLGKSLFLLISYSRVCAGKCKFPLFLFLLRRFPFLEHPTLLYKHVPHEQGTNHVEENFLPRKLLPQQ